jgi:hypothetical protein
MIIDDKSQIEKKNHNVFNQVDGDIYPEKKDLPENAVKLRGIYLAMNE